MPDPRSDDLPARDRSETPTPQGPAGSPDARDRPGTPSPDDRPQHPSVPDGPDATAPDPVGVFVRRILRILAEPQIAARVSAAGITVRIDLSDVPGRSVVLFFDRTPPTVEDDGRTHVRPTVRLVLDSRELDALLNEGSHLPMAILGGAVTFEGSVRKFLRVMPILRGGALRFDTDEEFEGGR